MIDARIQAFSDGMSPLWRAPTGLMRQAPGEEDSRRLTLKNGNGIESVANENGILFLAYFFGAAYCAGLKIFDQEQIRQDVAETIERLVRKPFQGLFNRQPDDVLRSEAHDNYVGIVLLSKLFKLDYHKQICFYGVGHGWNFNNVEPSRWEGWAQRQGGEVAFYNVAMGAAPELLNWFWFLGGLILGFWDRGNKGKTALAWARMLAMSLAIDEDSRKEKGSELPWWVAIPFFFVSLAFTMSHGELWEYFYHRPEHPTVVMAHEAKTNGL